MLRRSGKKRVRPSEISLGISKPTRSARARRRALAEVVEALESRVLLSTSVLTYHNDNQSSGVNPTETQITPGNLNVAQFSKHFSTPVDGQVYAQPLYVPNLNVTAGSQPGTHNVVFVATEHDSLYAIDANSGVSLYQISFLTAGLPGATSITTAPAGSGTDIGSTDLTPEIGITQTPVIDPSTNSLYLTAKTKQIISGDSAHPHYVYTMYKVNIRNATYISQIIGNTTYTPSNGSYAYDQSAGLPYIAGTGNGNVTVGGQQRIYFNALRQLVRPGAVLYNGHVYIASASHGDAGPYHGWLIGFDAATLQVTTAFNTTPSGGLGGIWEGGGITAIDANGYFYFETGNGSFNTNSNNFNAQGFPIDGNYGDSFVKVALDPTSTGPNTNANINGWGMKVVDYFSPFNNASLNGSDADLGSGGPVILPDSLGSAAHPHLLVGAGKEGKIYLIDRDNMGKFDPATDHVVQEQGSALNGSQGTAALFMTNPGTSTPGSGSATMLYGQGYGGTTRAFSVSNGAFSSSPTSQTQDSFGYLSCTPSVSSNGTTNAVMWEIDRGTNQLRAYDATNLNSRLWTSAQAANNRDSLGPAVKFTIPTIADGLVFCGTSNALVVYGPPVPPTEPPAAPTNLVATAASGIQIDLTWVDHADNEEGFEVWQSTDNIAFSKIQTVGVNSVSYSVTNLQAATQYWFKVRALNSFAGGSFSGYSNTATTFTSSQTPNLNFSNGFVGAPGTSLNFGGSAALVGTRAELTQDVGNQTGVVWSINQQDIRRFSSTFTFQIGGSIAADGFTFVVQRSSNTASGNGGGSLGYQNIPTSVALKFDIYQSISQTGMYQNGAQPGDTGTLNTLPNVDLHSGDIIRCALSYDGTTLSQILTDTATNLSFAHNYAVNIPSVIGGNNAWVGFTGATGGLTATQDILTWVFTTLPSSPPAPASNLSVTPASGTQLNLGWTDNSSTEDGFRIMRKIGAGGSYQFAANVGANVTSYMDVALTPNTDYYYQVFATNTAGDATGSNEAHAVTPVPPTTPTNGHATLVTTTQINLAWNDNSDNEDDFKIFRRAGEEGTFGQIADLPPDTTSYNDLGPNGLGLTPGVNYEYHIEAVNIAGYSDFTGVNVDTITLPPSNLLASASGGQVQLTWDEPPMIPDDGVEYSVYRGTSPGGQGAVPVATALPSPTYTDYAVSDGITYYYEVTAIDTGSESGASNESSTTATNTITGSGSDDAYYIRLDPTHTIVQVFTTGTPTGNPMYSLPYATLASLNFTTLAGNDELFVNLSNGSPIPIGGLGFDSGDDTDRFTLIGSTAAEVVSFGPVTINVAGSASITTANDEQVYFDGKDGWDTVSVDSGSTVVFPTTQHLQSLSLADGATAVVEAGANAVLVTRALDLAPSSVLDLTDNDLIFFYPGKSPLPLVQASINSARNAGAWTGNGLTSAAARDNPLHNTTLGAIEAADYRSINGAKASFDGEPLKGGTVLVKYTYLGDADLSGSVNFDDYVRLDIGFNLHRTGWFNGDFDGSGAVNFDDYVLIDIAFNTQGAPL